MYIYIYIYVYIIMCFWSYRHPIMNDVVFL